jgi:hypothetical protein
VLQAALLGHPIRLPRLIEASEISSPVSTATETRPEETREKRGLAFWYIIFAFCVTSVFSSLEGTISFMLYPRSFQNLVEGKSVTVTCYAKAYI